MVWSLAFRAVAEVFMLAKEKLWKMQSNLKILSLVLDQ